MGTGINAQSKRRMARSAIAINVSRTRASSASRGLDRHDGADRVEALAGLLNPDLSSAERAVAQVEGWILGVPGLIRAGQEREDSAVSAACDSSVFRLH
jgi:hypothetical protein